MLSRLIGAFVALFFLGYSPLSAGLYNPQSFTLPNGLKVVVIENHRAPVVTQMVWYRVGSADDPWGKSGLAHFLEHMMFKGPEGSASAILSKEVENLGGEHNAATSYDYTYYYETVASRYLEDIMRLESDRMKELRVLEPEAKNELQVILEERRMRTDNSPVGRFVEFFHSQFFRHDPRRLPPIGWEHEILRLTAKDAQAFHQEWYAPGNAILLLVGDVTFDQAKKLVQKYYAPLKARPFKTRDRLQEPPHPEGLLRFDLTMADVKVPYLIKAYPAPTVFTEEGRYAFSSAILEHYLGAIPTGFLHKSLVERKKLATFAQVYYPTDSLGHSYLMIISQPAPGVTLQALEEGLSDTLQTFKTQEMTQKSLDKIKTRMLSRLVYERDSALSGRGIGEGLILGRSLDDLDHWDAKIQEVPLQEVQKIYERIFESSYHVVGTILPKASEASSEEGPLSAQSQQSSGPGAESKTEQKVKDS